MARAFAASILSVYRHPVRGWQMYMALDWRTHKTVALKQVMIDNEDEGLCVFVSQSYLDEKLALNVYEIRAYISISISCGLWLMILLLQFPITLMHDIAIFKTLHHVNVVNLKEIANSSVWNMRARKARL